jgi:hypothetical protein
MRLFVGILVLWLYALPIHAQTASPLRITITNPALQPGDTALLEVVGPATTLTNTLTWYVDGTVASTGIGNTRLSVPVGQPGNPHTVYVELSTEEGIEQSPSVTVAGALVDIVWEGTGYTHPFYRGRALPGPDGYIVAEARSLFTGQDGSIVPVQNIYFTWKLNDQLLKASSGFGQYSLTLKAPPLYGEDILSVVAEDYNTYTRAEKKVRIPGVPPRTNLHPVDPLLGIQFHTVVGKERSTDAKASLIPYFTNITHLKDTGMHVSWFLFDNPLPASGLTITLPGTGIVRAVYQNKDSLLDNMSTRWMFEEEGDVVVERADTNVFSGRTE